MIDDIERNWSRVLHADVEIEYKDLAFGFYNLLIDGHFVDRFKSLAQIEDYLRDQKEEREVDAL